jgi:hypothetical protein
VGDLLQQHIERIKERIARPAAGLLPYRFLVPTAVESKGASRQTGIYEQQYDWDAFFEGVALCADGPERAELFRDSVRNFLHLTTAGGYTPRTLSPEKFWDYPDQMKPFLAPSPRTAIDQTTITTTAESRSPMRAPPTNQRRKSTLPRN